MPTNMTEIRDFVMRERELALSEREWKFRLRGYGYDIRNTDEGTVVTSLIGGREICTLGAAA
ncbi:hypothetical protein [Roseovarius phycicola]|uniref:Uncharacterized protein n=1 Tax=Roseovarius phycicola TaxID=3080976 RepID=A0ABZ2HHT4_9RHOB